MRELLKIAVAGVLGLMLGLVAISASAERPKGQIIEGCSQEDLDTPGARKCLNQGTLEGAEVYVTCAADGSQKCCVKLLSGETSCFAIMGRPPSSPSAGPRSPTPPKKVLQPTPQEKPVKQPAPIDRR